MSSDAALIPIRPGECWWCGDPADSREHKVKRSDLVREFGKPPYSGLRTLQHFTGQRTRSISGPGSKSFKFEASMCAACNNTRSQPFDQAWDTFTQYVVDNEEAIVSSRGIDLRSIFGSDWEARGADVARYLVKHLICRITAELPGPTELDADLFEFLDGGPFPESLQIDPCLDLGVVAMLELTRIAPADDPEAAEAAEAGFLYLGPIWVDLDDRQHWHTPQAGMHYRWLAFYWRIGDGGRKNPFAQPVVRLNPSDELFSPEVREIFEVQREIPREIFENIPDGVAVHEAVRGAGYEAAAARLEELAQRVNKRSAEKGTNGDRR
jgi:hypothetical protein